MPRLLGVAPIAFDLGEAASRSAKRPSTAASSLGSSSASSDKPVRAQQALCRSGPGADGDEAVPPAQPSITRDQPLSDGQRLALVRVDNCDLAQPPQQFPGAVA